MGSGPGCVQGPEGFPGSPDLLPLGACRLPTASHDAILASWRGDLAAGLALSGSRFAVRSWSGCSQILMLSQKSSNCATPRPDLAMFGSGSVLAPPL